MAKAADEFFEKIEAELGVVIPLHLKKQLTLHGFANNISLENISESDVLEIERFTKEELHIVMPEKKTPDYLGVFNNNAEKFLFFGGEKKMIWKLKEHVRNRQNIKSKLKPSSNQSNKKMSLAAKNITPEMAIENLDDERRCLSKLVNKHIKESLVLLDENKRSTVLSKIDEISYNCQVDENCNVYCNIACVLCDVKIKVQKYRKSSNTSTRWLVGNFKQHFLKHSKDKNLEDRKKTKGNLASTSTNTIHNYMAPTSSKSTDISRPGTLLEDSLPSTSFDKTCGLSPIASQPPPVQVSGKRNKSSNEDTGEVSVKKSRPVRLISESSSEIDDPDFHKGRANDTSETICPAHFTAPAVSNESKWKQEKYSRRLRERRKREKQTNNQPVITNYLRQVTEISKLVQANKELKDRLLEELPLILPANKSLDRLRSADENIQSLLTLLQKSAVSNKNKIRNNEYESDLIQFCLYLYIIGGKLIYETLHANLKKVIPSLSTVQRHINNSNFITEASLRFAELNDFLSKRNLPKVVWISEDATGITGRIQYCYQTDSIIGFVSPFDKDGLPKRDHFPADSVRNIQKYFCENERAKYAYVVMAQSPIDKSASFCINVFGTDNRFSHQDVARRWITMKQEAANFGIRILGFSSDGDTRLMKTMRIFSKFQCANENQEWKWFQMNLGDGDICVQDTVHIATKMRTRILNGSIDLQLGNYKATASHLADVVNRSSKDKHLLTLSDLKPDDKMNFKAAEKIASPLVEKVLKEFDDQCDGTIAFLKLTRLILQAFLNKNETPYTRIYNMWYSVFFLRIWRDWLHESDNLSVTKNFVSLNCYLCFELNAHAIIKLVRLYRDNSTLSQECTFTPWLFSSQPCEQIFRATRSLTSTFSTVVNFSVYDILKRLNKIQQINTVITDLSDKVIFPREAKHTKMGKNNSESEADIHFLSDQEIQQCVMNALHDVRKDCEKLKITPSSDESWQEVKIFNSNIEKCESLDTAQKVDTLSNENEIDLRTCDNINEDSIAASIAVEDRLNNLLDSDDEKDNNGPPPDIADMIQLDDTKKTYGEFLNMTDLGNEHKSERSFLKIKVGNDIKTIRKSSLCWLLNEQSTKLSADRLIRVRGNPNIVNKSRNNSNALKDITNAIPIALENYYAVYYDDGWYIGRVIEELSEQLSKDDSKTYKVKFLRETFGQFQWPKQDDVQIVEECFIFDGPISMSGSTPMTISQVQRGKIIREYKEMKRNRRSD